MAHQHHRLASALLGQTAQDDSFIQTVEVAGRFIQQNERCIVQEGTRHADALAFAARKSVPQLAHRCIVALRQRHDKVMDGRLFTRAFTHAYVGYVHAIAHNLGGLYGTPHGLANAVILPYVLDYYGDCIYPQLAKLADIAGVSAPGMSTADKGKAFIAAIRQMNENMNIPSTFDMIKEEDIPLLVQRALKEGNPLYPVPKIMDAKDCEAVIRSFMA